MHPFSLVHLGDQAVTLSLGNDLNPVHHQRIVAVRRWLQDHPFPGLLDIVIAYSSLTVVYDATPLNRLVGPNSCVRYVEDVLRQAITSAESVSDMAGEGAEMIIPVCYDEAFAPDLHVVCRISGLSPDDIVQIHTSRVYTVYMVGFLPGFPYLAEVDQRLRVGRKDTPVKVEAGSVGLAGVQTGIYPMTSPGGWQIIGRTPVSLFDANRQPCAILQPGDKVRFVSINRSEFDNVRASS